MKVISINNSSGKPKYKQIITSVESAIIKGNLKKGDRLPSVNKIALEFSISRDTVLTAYDALKKRGIITAVSGKGYYVKSEEFNFDQRIFLLFDELNAFKENLYNAFIEGLQGKAKTDVFFHYFSIDVFKKLINENNGSYSRYVIMPTNLKGAADIIKLLPEKEVYILDQTNADLSSYPAVYQNFKKDIYNALKTAKERLSYYQKLILVFDSFKEPKGMIEGFIQFCEEYNFPHTIITDFTESIINNGEVYIVPDDRHLVNIIEQSKIQGLEIGKDVGIISYNDTPLKKVVANGITAISTDFKAMGKLLAKMVLQQKNEQIENECRLIIRNSL